jgi:hypothetical protein
MTGPTSPTSNDAERTKAHFFGLGVHYYVTARFAVFAQFNPVCGNLFHHAIEMFLKGGLAHLGLVELKRLGHKLPAAWSAFKGGDVSLDRFDSVIGELDKFESIRYPDLVLEKGMLSYIALQAPAVIAPSSVMPSVSTYQLAVAQIDQLVKAIFQKASVNPRFFTNSFNAVASAYFEKEPGALI